MGKQICFDKVGGFGLKTRSCTLSWLIYFNSKKMFFMSLIFVINLAKIITVNITIYMWLLLFFSLFTFLVIFFSVPGAIRLNKILALSSRKFNLIINKLPKFYKINISIYIYLHNSFIGGDIYYHIYIVRQITASIRIFRKIDNSKKSNLNY